MTRRTAHRAALMIFLMAVVAAWVGLDCHSRRRSERLRELGREVESWSGEVSQLTIDSPYEPLRTWFGRERVNSIIGPEGYFVQIGGGTPTHEQLARLHEFRPLRAAWLIGEAKVGDGWIEGLRDPWAVRDLNLCGTSVSDRCLPKLLSMSDMRYLTVIDTAISDDAIFRLVKLPRLEHLTIGGPNSRAMRLVDFDPGYRAGRGPRVQFRVAVDPRVGVPSNVLVSGYHQDSGWSFLRQQPVKSEESPGVFAYDSDVPGLPVGDHCSWRVEVQSLPPRGSPIVYCTFQSRIKLAGPKFRPGG